LSNDLKSVPIKNRLPFTSPAETKRF
jgi:hypothetical protein